MNIDGCKNEIFNGSNRLLGYDQEIVAEVNIYTILYNKEEIKNGEHNYIRDSTREDKDENLNVLKYSLSSMKIVYSMK